MFQENYHGVKTMCISGSLRVMKGLFTFWGWWRGAPQGTQWWCGTSQEPQVGARGSHPATQYPVEFYLFIALCFLCKKGGYCKQKSSQAPSYASPKLRPTHSLMGVKCRATSVAKKWISEIGPGRPAHGSPVPKTAKPQSAIIIVIMVMIIIIAIIVMIIMIMIIIITTMQMPPSPTEELTHYEPSPASGWEC